FSQDGIVVKYSKGLQDVEITHENPNIVDQLKKSSEEMKKNIRRLSYSLLINNGKSLFSSDPIISTDSHNDRNLGLAISVGQGAGTTYVDINGSKIRSLDAYGEKFLIISNLNDLNWKITEEKKVIQGFQCYRATTVAEIKNSQGVREILVEAWFSPDLPFPYGPAGYGRLPGLILRLQNGKYSYNIEKIQFSMNLDEIEKPDKGKTVTQKQFDEIGARMWENRG